MTPAQARALLALLADLYLLANQPTTEPVSNNVQPETRKPVPVT